MPDNQPSPPPKREPDPEPEWPRVMHPAQMEVLRDERERVYRLGNSVGKTHRIVDPIDHPPRHQPLQCPPWAPPRRVADPEKKRARKAQKRARRAGR